MSAVLQFPTLSRSDDDRLRTALIGFPQYAIDAALVEMRRIQRDQPNADPVATAAMWAHARYCPTPPDAA